MQLRYTTNMVIESVIHMHYLSASLSPENNLISLGQNFDASLSNQKGMLKLSRTLTVLGSGSPTIRPSIIKTVCVNDRTIPNLFATNPYHISS